MPSFKPKVAKKINVNSKSIVTLDKKHQEYCDSFNNNEQIEIPKLEEKKKELINNLKVCKNIEEQMDLKDEILQIKHQIKKLKHDKKNYYLDNSKFIFDYFEDKKDINKGNVKVKTLDSFFNINKNKEKDEKQVNIVNSYLSNIDDNFIDLSNYTSNEEICKNCGEGELIPIDDEGLLVCNKCFIQIPFLIENEKPSYKEPPKEVCFYAYKRINHFREILAQFQAKESTQIPEKVIEDIKNQIKKERIELKQITNSKAKEILKKLGYNKYYEHIPFIKDMIGIKPPIMTPELEDTLCNLFIEIQAPYAKFCPDDRVNFLNYYYTVYKLCELLDQKQFLPYFPMLKDREKRIEQDVIWKKICNELDWEFIPTI
tara:strand:+ start:6206 stop:7321 length:1116 start_codon:yes stop_codon:yes gene_type:complete